MAVGKKTAMNKILITDSNLQQKVLSLFDIAASHFLQKTLDLSCRIEALPPPEINLYIAPLFCSSLWSNLELHKTRAVEHLIWPEMLIISQGKKSICYFLPLLHFCSPTQISSRIKAIHINSFDFKVHFKNYEKCGRNLFLWLKVCLT